MNAGSCRRARTHAGEGGRFWVGQGGQKRVYVLSGRPSPHTFVFGLRHKVRLDCLSNRCRTALNGATRPDRAVRKYAGGLRVAVGDALTSYYLFEEVQNSPKQRASEMYHLKKLEYYPKAFKAVPGCLRALYDMIKMHRTTTINLKCIQSMRLLLHIRSKLM